jgi:uncharacterized membrane protein
MAPLVALIAAFVLFRCLGFLWPCFSNWHLALRAALGVMFLLTASAHWGRRRPDLIRMVPDGVGDPATWVTATGLAEIAIAAGLQIPRLAEIVAVAAIIMLCCIFPANVKAAREHLTILDQPVPSIVPRLLIQLVFIGAIAASVWHH